MTFRAIPLPHEQTRIHFRMGTTWSFAVMHYNSTWRIHRRLFHRFFNISVVDQFDDKIHGAVSVFLHRLTESPERFSNHAHLYVSLYPSRSLRCVEVALLLLIAKPHWIFDLFDRVWGEYQV